MVHVLVVEDDVRLNQIVCSRLNAAGYAAHGCLNAQEAFDALFAGDLETMYQIVFEAWKYNKLAPFKLAARFGLQTKVTDPSSAAAGTETNRGPRLAMSGVSPMK